MREKATLFCRGLQRLLFCGLLVSALIFAACNKTPGSQGSGYTVTFSVEGSNGTLTAQVGGKTIPHSPIKGLSAGSKVMFTATPSSGYTVQQWTENKKPVDGTNTSYTLVVKDNSSVTVQFMKAEKSAPQPPNDPSAPQPPASAVKHKVTITDITNGSVTATPALPKDGMVAKGSEIKFTANANEGYKINEWTVTGGTVTGESAAGTPTVTVKITADTTVSVSFIEKDKPLTAYKVNFSADTTKGSLTATVDGKFISSGDPIISGKNVMFTAAPKDGYMLTSWKVNDATVTGTDLTRTIRIEKDTTVSAVFEKYYTVTLGNIEHGKLSVSPEWKDGKVAENTVLTFTATPDEGYEVDTWTVSDGSFEAGTGADGQTEAKLKVTKDVTVGVSFKLKTFKVTYSADSGSAGLTLRAEYEGSPGGGLSSPVTVEYGKTLFFTAEYDLSISDKRTDWSITGSTPKEGGKPGDKTAKVTITKDTEVMVKLVPISAAEILNRLSAPPMETDKDFSLTTQLGAQNITWTSDSDAIKIENDKAFVTRDLVDQTVKLTAALTQGSETATRSFDVTVKALKEVNMPPDLTCKFDNSNLTIVRANGDGKARYMVTAIDTSQKTLTAGLTAEWQIGSGSLKTLEELERNEKETPQKYVTTRQRLAEKDVLSVSIVKAAFEQMELSDKDFFEKNKDLFGDDKSYEDFITLPEAEQTTIIKASLEKQRKAICDDVHLSPTASWQEILQKVMKAIEHRYTFKARSVLYTYTLTKISDNKYTITIESKYDKGKPWYAQKGSYKTANDGYILSIDEQQPPPTLIIKTKDDKKYQCSLSEVKNNGSFTATNKADGNDKITVTVDDSQKNGTLTGTIGGSPYTASFKSVNME